MGDQLLALVPRLIEGEPGYRSTALFSEDPRDLTLSTAGTTQKQPTAYLEPVSRRWMGAPNSATSAAGSAGWTMLTGQAKEEVEPGNNKGVVVSEEGTEAEPWVAEYGTDLDRLVGFQVSFSPFEPEDWDTNRTLPLRFEWGDKWRLEVTGTEQQATLARLYEKAGPPDAEWVIRELFPLFRGKFFNPPSIHQLWIQPLGPDEFLIRNLDHDDLGIVVVTKTPVSYDPDEGTEDDKADGVQHAPWDTAKLRISGVPRAYFTVRTVEFPATWSVETTGTLDLGYICTQAVTIATTIFLPDGLRTADSAYAVTAAVYQGAVSGATPWAGGANRSDYSYKVVATGPSDGTLSGYSKQAVILDDLRLTWPKTTASDGAVAVDLFAAAGIAITSVEEYRGPDDADTRLVVAFTGDWDSYATSLSTYCAPNARWQWKLDTDGDDAADYIRFDGLRETAELRKYTVQGATGREYRIDGRIVLRSRWRQLDQVVFRDGVPLDGLARSEAYYLLMSEVPLDGTEGEVATLVDDDALPSARPGKDPEFLPRVGSRLSDVVKDVQRLFGPDDRIRFVDRSGVATLYVDQPTTTSQATFYRTQAAADAAGKPGQVLYGDVDDDLLSLSVSDDEFFNEIVVVGQDKDDPRRLISAHYANPPSWQTTTDPLYVGVRKLLVAVRPELNTQGDVDTVAAGLQRSYADRFRKSVQFASHLVYSLYPGDVVTLDAGADPGDATQAYRIRGMTTRLLDLSLATTRRYRTIYEVQPV